MEQIEALQNNLPSQVYLETKSVPGLVVEREQRYLRYFAYGSNMDQSRMSERKARFRMVKGATLRGYNLVFNKQSSKNPEAGFANIEPNPSSLVEGIIYYLSEGDLLKLDKFEGYPVHYDRKAVEVMLKEGKKVFAITYIAKKEKTREGLKPIREYLNHLLAGRNFLSKEYQDMLEKITTLD